jgi:hypothetical protein
MPRVVPSQIIEVIDQLFPEATINNQATVRSGPSLAAILSLTKELSPELLTLSGQDLSDYIVAISLAETVQKIWTGSGNSYQVNEHRGMSMMALLRQALAKCPDEVPSPSTTGLVFIADADLRESIRRDISAANQDMVNAEWKGATVLAGSATEALLLWGVEENAGSIATAVNALVAAGTLTQRPHSNPGRWTFIELIEVTLQLSLITPETAMQARLGKDFRNLIHPGRAARLGQVCDRATALSALAAVEHVVRDLTP